MTLNQAFRYENEALTDRVEVLQPDEVAERSRVARDTYVGLLRTWTGYSIPDDVAAQWWKYAE